METHRYEIDLSHLCKRPFIKMTSGTKSLFMVRRRLPVQDKIARVLNIVIILLYICCHSAMVTLAIVTLSGNSCFAYDVSSML